MPDSTRKEPGYIKKHFVTEKRSYSNKIAGFLGVVGALALFLVVAFNVYYLINPKSINYSSGVLQGDVNNDGRVDILDFQLLSNSFGKSAGQSGYLEAADINGDSSVNVLDFQLLSNSFGNSGTTSTPTQRPSITSTRTPTPSGPAPTLPPNSGVPCSSLSGIERRFPCSPLVVGPMPESTSSSGVNSWSMFTNTSYPGTSGNGINERFTAVPNPNGSGVVVRNQNVLSDGDGHTTVGTGRSLPNGSTECSAFRWLWKNSTEFPQRTRVLVWQLQMSGSPIVAVATDESNHSWFFRTRNGSDGGLVIPLGSIQWGRWAYFVVCTHLSDSNGSTKIWFRHDSWPDVNGSPTYQRSGHDTYQGETGHNTLGIYAGPDGSSTSYYGYFDRYGRALTPQRAVQIAGNH